ncbi:cell division protein FtsZ, partial [uncultured Paracoccus sp.]|uniref:cell division protein FtsZ n=1 Tax=uncultured Paracoccus sp. TaxID=189685 RepID=UPI0025FF4B5F
MNLNLMMNDEDELKPRITVFGVGGAGGNAVNNMIEKNLDGVEFVVANTDAQALSSSRASNRIQMGPKVTEGLGAGAKPAIGAKAAEETIEDIVDHLMGAHMCFITAGMGGGTGTGAAPIIAQAAREMGILTVGVVTKPFQFEGTKRMRQADEGIEALHKVVDTLLIIPNQNLFRIANEKTTFTEAFAMADDVLYQGVKGVTDLMVKPGLINLDFADVRSVMDEMGKAMMGTGEASGENRAQEAAERAIANPLLDEVSLNGAKGVLINITGGYDMTLFELDEAANVIRDKVDSDANIIVGSTLDPDMDGSIRVSVVATGIDAAAALAEVPAPRRSMAEPLTQNPAVSQKVETAPQADDLPPRRVAPPVAETRAAASAAPTARIEDEMPAPAYQRKEAAQPMMLNVKEDAGFIAPRAPQNAARGQASPETLERLRRAVENKGERQQPQPAPQQAEPARNQSRMAGLG